MIPHYPGYMKHTLYKNYTSAPVHVCVHTCTYSAHVECVFRGYFQLQSTQIIELHSVNQLITTKFREQITFPI